ncbi:MAG: hypothetical protein V1674_06920 [Candidatus Omnitrophota bacterium]
MDIKKIEARNPVKNLIWISCLFFVLTSSGLLATAANAPVNTEDTQESNIQKASPEQANRGIRSVDKITIQKLTNGHFEFLVNNKPFIIKGACYNPVPIGQGYDYDLSQDKHRPWQTDAPLMFEAGVNVIRLYHPGKDIANIKKMISYFYRKYGIRTILGHWLGFWEGHCSSYGDKDFRQRIKSDCLEMVRTFKDEPGILMWVLGNENNYSFGPQNLNPWTTPQLEEICDPYLKRKQQAEIYYAFVNDIAREIKKIDKIHPIALGNGGLGGLDTAALICKDVDLLGISNYAGKSFGSLFRQVNITWARPFFFTEFGCDSFDAKQNIPSEATQALFIRSQWKEIEKNLFDRHDGLGNCLGACLFEWTDEWWKYGPGSWTIQDTEASWSNGGYFFDIAAPKNLNMNEEWWGIIKLSPGDTAGLDKRTPKEAYYILEELWLK